MGQKYDGSGELPHNFAGGAALMKLHEIITDRGNLELNLRGVYKTDLRSRIARLHFIPAEFLVVN